MTGLPSALALILFPSLLLVGSALWAMQYAQRRSTLLRLRTAMGARSGMAPPSSGPAGLLRWLGTNIPGASDGSLQAELARAGYFQPTAVPVFVALRLLCAILVFLSALASRGAGSAGLLLAVFSAFFCSRLFVICLKLKAEARGREIRSELPPVVDILLMVLNSGISIDQCLRHVTGMLDRTAPCANAALRRYVADTDNGMPYEAAFERLGQHLGIAEGYDLAGLIKQALMQGGEIMVSLDRFGAELAEKRVAAAREQIGRRSIFLTIAMLAFFMPVLMVALAGPAVSNITDTLKIVKQELRQKESKR